MADGFKLRINAKLLAKLAPRLSELTNRAIDARTASVIGRTTISQMKDLISKGISPIRGKRRFPAYKPSYRKTRRRFGKRLRPVDLNLTGEFLKSLKFTTRGGTTIINYQGRKQRDKERGHREGANNQRKRPTLPQGRESFAEKIVQSQINIYAKRLEKVLSKL